MDDPIEPIFTQMATEIREAQAKYDTLVRHLKDTEFIAIFQAVMKERDRRVAFIFATNPLVQKMELDRSKAEVQAAEEAMRDERN